MMKVHPQVTDDMTRVGEILETQPVVMLTLNEPGTGLTSRPMTPLELDDHGSIWFFVSQRSMLPLLGGAAVSANLAVSDIERSTFLSISGEAELVDDAARKSALWTAMARPWFHGDADPDLTLLKLTPNKADIWSGPDSRVVRLAALALSVMAARPIGLGRHEVVEPELFSDATPVR